MSQPELEFFSTPPSSVITTSESPEPAITAIGNGTQELMDFWFEKSSPQLLSAVANAADFLQKLSQEFQKKGGVGQFPISELISYSQQMGTPEITEMLIKMNNEIDNVTSSQVNGSQQNVVSSREENDKISDCSPSQPNHRNKYHRLKDVPSILRRKKRLEKFDCGFMDENKGRHLEKYLNNMKYSPNNFETMMLKYPEEREYQHQFDFNKNRKRLRKSSVSSCRTSPCNSSETDNSNLSEYDSKIDKNTKYTMMKRKSAEIDATSDCVERQSDIPEEFEKNMPYGTGGNPPQNREKTTGRKERNRLAAQKLREKKRFEKLSLETQEEELIKENAKLKMKIEHLELDIKIFRKIIQQYDHKDGP